MTSTVIALAAAGCDRSESTSTPAAKVAEVASAPAKPAQKAENTPTTPVVPAAQKRLLQSAAAPELAASGDTSLCYRWEHGQQYSYRITCKAEVGDTILETTGTNTYTAGRRPEATVVSSDSEARPGSGTAFVISPDGYLVTCDHVVRGATDIKVTLGSETIPCEVVGRDSAHDVAVIRVARHGLPALPLADSESVELAEEVRAIGYPLSNMLGSTVKVTQGSISGIVPKPRGKVFQIDAVVNPGNSGGPLLDQRGAVVGVVNAQLVGFEISKVGFAVPVNYAKTLLSKHRVSFQSPAATAKLDGPALAKRVTPSVGLVTMMCHGEGFSYADDDQPTLYYHGILERRKQPRPANGATVVPAAIDSSDRDDGRLVVDDFGDVSHFDGRVNLPCLLGSLGLAPIDALPSKGEKAWERQETLLINVRGRSDPLAGIRPRGFASRNTPPPPPLPPFLWGREEPEDQCQATQKVNYTVDKPNGSTVLIHKTVAFKTRSSARVRAQFELSGKGETLFDLKAGVPKKITFSGTFTVREDGKTAELPVTLLCELIAQAGAPSAAPPTAVATAPTAVAIESPESAKARLTDILADLSAVDKDWNKCFRALQELSMMTPIEDHRDEVAEVLDVYLAEKNDNARVSALRAIRKWGTRRNVPSLIALLKPSESDSVRRRAIEALGNLGDAKAAPAIAKRMKDASDRAAAARALRSFGRAAEDSVIALLAEKDAEVRNVAYAVLSEIGGAKSVKALTEQLAKSDAAARMRIKAALDKLQEKK